MVKNMTDNANDPNEPIHNANDPGDPVRSVEEHKFTKDEEPRRDIPPDETMVTGNRVVPPPLPQRLVNAPLESEPRRSRWAAVKDDTNWVFWAMIAFILFVILVVGGLMWHNHRQKAAEVSPPGKVFLENASPNPSALTGVIWLVKKQGIVDQTVSFDVRTDDLIYHIVPANPAVVHDLITASVDGRARTVRGFVGVPNHIFAYDV